MINNLLFTIYNLTQASPIHAQDLQDIYLQGSDLTSSGTNITIAQFLQPIIYNFPIITGLLSFVFIFLAGFRYVSSAGNADETQKAANMLTYSLMGMALSVLAFWITRIVFKAAGLGNIF